MTLPDRIIASLDWHSPRKWEAIVASVPNAESSVIRALPTLIEEGRILWTPKGYLRAPVRAPRIADLTRADPRETLMEAWCGHAAGGAL